MRNDGLELLVRHVPAPCDSCVRQELAQKRGNRDERPSSELVQARRSSFGFIFRINFPQLPPSGFIRQFCNHVTSPELLVRRQMLNYSKHSHWPGPSATNG